MSSSSPSRYRITLSEVHPDGTQRPLVDGTCSAFLLAMSGDRDAELRVLTDHDGPVSQRKTMLESLTAHVRATIGLER